MKVKEKLEKILVFVSTFGVLRCLNYIDEHYVYMLLSSEIILVKVFTEG